MTAERALRILLIDDDAEDAVLFLSLLRAAPFRLPEGTDCDVAESAETAHAKLAAGHYDVCFCDYRLGADDGIKFLRRMRDGGFSRPIIMLTGQGDEAVAVEAMKAGATDYLVKRALTPNLLAAALRHAMQLLQEEERRLEIQRELELSEQRYRDLVDRLPVIVCELDADGKTLFVNRAAEAITGYEVGELVGGNWWRALTPQRHGSRIVELQAALRSGDVTQFEMPTEGRNHRNLTFEWSSANRYRSDGSLANVACIGMDVTERVRLREELRQMAVRDELTGLNNRRGFMNLAEMRLKQASRDQTRMLVVFIDIDGLKTINDRLGHAEGDRALRDLAEVVTETFRESDVLGRLGGDEFVALVAEGAPTRDDGAVHRLQDHMDAFNADSDRPYVLAASIGVARYDPGAPAPLDQLLSRADTQMYEQKQSRRDRKDVLRAAGSGDSGSR
ncbi:MAG: diguanylate cyclase [Alphaproteobacteria bacterium]|jgi:diguanylate cyclase (GGDEF)-like protein/PAS domain S-box-containing protein|nr:diguanylate cyclase [Alphaproteobacteria bacterium]MDP6515344.1 diguanylate cyclase [Alphaproteobacteria bacterium]